MSGLDGFTATGRTGAVDQVIAYVRYAVKNGTYNVGDKLPNESELAATIGVGRSSLREDSGYIWHRGNPPGRWHLYH